MVSLRPEAWEQQDRTVEKIPCHIDQNTSGTFFQSNHAKLEGTFIVFPCFLVTKLFIYWCIKSTAVHENEDSVVF